MEACPAFLPASDYHAVVMAEVQEVGKTGARFETPLRQMQTSLSQSPRFVLRLSLIDFGLSAYLSSHPGILITFRIRPGL